MSRVFVTRILPGRALQRLQDAGHEVDVWPNPGPPPAEMLRERCRDADALLCMLTDRVDGALLSAAPSLKAIANYAVGYDNIDVAACRARGIAVSTTPDVLTDATADLTMALLLASARQLFPAAQSVHDGEWLTWQPRRFLGMELSGRQIAVVGGHGRIGQAVARRAAAFGMDVRLVGRDDDLHMALRVADVVSLHAPLTDETRHMIDADALSVMQPHAILVNTARGGLIDQTALRAALRDSRLGAAALDVTDPEPLVPGDPLFDAPNLIVLPHIGSATVRARERMADLSVDNLLTALTDASYTVF
ncbi:MAG: D-glycerate dehydrogenase [Baekduia sp.]